jgi:glycosyltransferase involved in cell wall biosynthesis
MMISLSVPVYNEEGSIEELFEKVRKVMNRHGTPWEIIFINDGSPDRSEEILDWLARLHPEVKVALSAQFWPDRGNDGGL